MSKKNEICNCRSDLPNGEWNNCPIHPIITGNDYSRPLRKPDIPEAIVAHHEGAGK